jgi:ABC-type sugar transport system permease subunit
VSAKGLRMSTKRAIEGYIFLLPWLIGFTVFLGIPLFQSLMMSLSKVNANFQGTFTGLANYRELLLANAEFTRQLVKTIRNMALDVPVILVFSLLAAILVNQKLPGRGFFRSVFFVPVVITSGAVMKYLFDANVGTNLIASGNLWAWAKYLGPEFTQNLQELLNRISLVLWHSGVQILIFLAGLQSIAPSLYEASRVDGANDWEIFWKITLPMISPMILLNAIYSIVDSFHDTSFNGIIPMMQNTMFRDLAPGLASAMGWLYFLTVLLVLGVVFLISRRSVYYGGER